MRTSERSPRISALAHPRDHADFILRCLDLPSTVARRTSKRWSRSPFPRIRPTRNPSRPACCGTSATASVAGCTSAGSRPRSTAAGRVAAGELPIPGEHEASLAGRLPDDLRNTAADLRFASLPFTALYRTDVEFAAELSNRTVHGVMHLAWWIRAQASTRDRWPSTSSRVVYSEGLHGADQAVPVLDYLPSTHAPDQADLGRPPLSSG